MEEEARFVDGEMLFTEDRFSELDDALSLLKERLMQGEKPAVSLIRFEADEKKAGGAYRIVEGTVKKLDEYERALVLEDGRKTMCSRYWAEESPELFISSGQLNLL